MPSEQLVHYLTLRGEGCSVATAADESGIGEEEAWLHEESVKAGELKFIEPSRAHVHVHEGQPNEEEAKMVNGTVAGDELKLLIERIERLKEEIKALNEDVSDVYQEAKARGFDTATMKRVIKLRKMDDSTRDEATALLDVYLSALGMTPIEQAIALAA